MLLLLEIVHYSIGELELLLLFLILEFKWNSGD